MEVYSIAHTVLSEKFTALLADNGKELAAEYSKLADIDFFEPCKVGEQRKNARKNRYVNVLPYDFNRVTISGETDYINASLVQSPSGAQPQWKYIATQGPLGDTTPDFWHMVFDSDCGAIVMLTKCIESRSVKCADYFPATEGTEMASGSFKIKVLDVRVLSEDITHRMLQVTDTESNSSRCVCHYHYHRWPDHGVPEGTEFLRQLSVLLDGSKASEKTIIAHCSAGIGRTGTFCAVDIILRRLRWLAAHGMRDPEAIRSAVDVHEVVASLRKQRRGMVQTLDQYYFCYRAIMEELRSHL